MINRREKLQLFNKLRGTGHAEADLVLLKEVNPRHPKLTRFARDPKRYADEILYALLDECDEGDIVDHRIYFEKLNENIDNTSTEGEQGPADGSSNTSADDKQIPDDGSSNTSAMISRYLMMAQVILQPMMCRDLQMVQVILQLKKSRYLQMVQVILQPKKKLLKVKVSRNQSNPILPILARTQKKVVQKEEEYPNIDWDNLYNEDVQMATVIYNDRINTWRKMKKLDELLDKKPKANDVAAMAELRIRNLQAFEELKAYNDTGKFLYKHPLLKGKSEFDELVKLFKKDPAEFLHKHKNVLDNIKRYKSYIKRDDRKDKRASDRENLQRHQERERMFKMVMEQYSDKSDKSDG